MAVYNQAWQFLAHTVAVRIIRILHALTCTKSFDVLLIHFLFNLKTFNNTPDVAFFYEFSARCTNSTTVDSFTLQAERKNCVLAF